MRLLGRPSQLRIPPRRSAKPPSPPGSRLATPDQGPDVATIACTFRQLLAGRDFAADDPIARQMVNFVYLVGDRETGEALVVDPAYGVGELVDIARRPTACASPARSSPTTTPTTSAAT